MLDRHQDPRRLALGIAPPARLALAIRELIGREGEPATAARLGLGRPTIVRLAGRMTCRWGSILQAALALGINLDGGDDVRR
jgi:hypothetical protein